MYVKRETRPNPRAFIRFKMNVTRVKRVTDMIIRRRLLHVALLISPVVAADDDV